MSTVVSPADVAAAAQLACLLESGAPKPGNVSPGRHYADVRYEHFLASAAAIGGPLAGAAERPVGSTIRLAIESTARWAPSNTNLGTVLLLAPVAAAALADCTRIPLFAGPAASQGRFADWLRGAVRDVLAATTVADAREAYAAIRRAAPGGLGRVEAEDVMDEPDVTLLEAMRLAADRDDVAREYATGYEITFELGLPALARARRDGLDWNDAVVETFLTILAARPDTHIARRAGRAAAEDVARRARAVVRAGGVRSDEGRRALARLDAALRDARHLRNPGTTADLTAAALFVWLLDGGWR
jgi:triphosphoribosyl-dephospho-CoA synthase